MVESLDMQTSQHHAELLSQSLKRVD